MVLASIVLVAVKGLIDIRELRHVWRVSRYEFFVSVIGFAAVLVLGILKGVIFAVLASMLLLIRRAAHPRVAILGRIPGTRRFSDIQRHPDNEVFPGVLILRVEGSLLYFNAEHGDCWFRHLYRDRGTGGQRTQTANAGPRVRRPDARSADRCTGWHDHRRCHRPVHWPRCAPSRLPAVLAMGRGPIANALRPNNERHVYVRPVRSYYALYS